MTSPSFERIDYQLRYNKHIERKLVFDLLAKSKPFVGFDGHAYIGFGSMWFSDFRLAHRILGLTRMISMEREEYAERAEFNLPYRCIEVRGGNSTECLSGLKPEEWQSPFISWLDYDGCLDDSVVKDLGIFLDRCLPNSVLLTSINANRSNYRPRNMPPSRTRIGTALGQVEALLGNGVVPPRFEPKEEVGAHGDVPEDRFAEFLAESLLAFMVHRVAASGRKYGVTAEGDNIPLSFLPLFNFCHKDGVEMVTVGGVVCSGANVGNPWRDDIALGVERNPLDRLPVHRRLDLVPLTLKEKMTLDSCLPHIEQNFIDDAKGKGVRLADSELSKYWRYYDHFPVFFEVPV